MAKKKFTVKDVVTILEDVLDEYINHPDEVFYGELLIAQGLYRQRLNNFINVKPNKQIIDLYNLLKEIQESRLHSKLLNKNSSTGAIFMLKCNHGYVEAEKAKALELQELSLKQDDVPDGELNINFNIVEHRSDDEIQDLLTEAGK